MSGAAGSDCYTESGRQSGSGRHAGPLRNDDCAQSNVVGVAILIGLTMLSLGTLTVAVGTVVESNSAAASADRVADDLQSAIQPVEATGYHEREVAFTAGELSTVDRSVRVFRDGEIVISRDGGGLAFTSGDHRVTAAAGAVVRDHGGSATLADEPPVAVSDDVVLLGVVAVSGTAGRTLTGDTTTRATVATDVAHDRTELGEAEFGIAVETGSPDAWSRFFQGLGDDVDVERRSFEGDDHASVVATFEGERTGYAVVHEVELEVRRG